MLDITTCDFNAWMRECIKERLKRQHYEYQRKLKVTSVSYFTKWYRYFFVTPKPPKHKVILPEIVACRSHDFSVARSKLLELHEI